MKLVQNIHKDILAKSYVDANGNNVAGVSVFVHCLIVGIVCREFVKYLPKRFVKKFNIADFAIWCARHDIGKISPGFQYKIRCAINGIKEDSNTTNKYVMRHEIVSGAYLNDRYNDLLERAECILGMIEWHHGGDRTERHETGKSKFSWEEFEHIAYGENEWDTMRDAVDNALVDVFGDGKSFVNTWYKLKKGNKIKSITDSEVKYMMGLLSVCDWIGSDDSNVFKVEDFLGDEIDIDLIADYANNAIIRFGLNFNGIKHNLTFKELFGFDPYSLQASFPKIIDSYGLYIIEAPMAGGKSETALAGAYYAMNIGLVNGIYFALPTQMTSNSMFDRYKKFVSIICDSIVPDVRLVHGKAVYTNSDNNGMRSWYHGNKRGTIAQFGLGTIDQALMSVIASMKHFYIRSFGLANKAIIIDEVHSYDVYTGSLVRELIQQLIELDCVVIVLSATLTAHNRGLLTGSTDYIDQYPLITKVVGDDVNYKFCKSAPENRTYKIDFHKIPTRSDFIGGRVKILEEALKKVEKGEMVLWIENTVSDSQQVYNWFSERVSDVGLLNSWFTNKDREDNESKWVDSYGKGGKRDKGMILVSTQVCEQSIDIDADFLVTALCPTDMLLQRLGREHRHYKLFKRDYMPECVILYPEALEHYETDSSGANLVLEYRDVVGSSAWVYSSYILKRTYSVWKNFSKVVLPKDIRTLLELTYDDKYVGDAIDIDLKKHDLQRVRVDTTDALNTLAGGLGTRNDNDDITRNDDPDTEYNTRKITIATREVFLVSSIDETSITTIYGVRIAINDRMSVNDKKLLNDCGIKVRNNHITRFINVFRIRTIGKYEYVFCLLNDGISVDSSNRVNQDVCYTKSGGFVIRTNS